MKSWPTLGALLAPIAALAVGVGVMRTGGVPSAIWMLNIAAATVGILLAVAALAKVGTVGDGRGVAVQIGLVVPVVLLGATLVVPGMEGVHRWLPLGPVRVHAGALVLPPLLVFLWKAPWPASTAAALLTLVVLLLQPDAAQAASFCAAWTVVVGVRREAKWAPVVITSLLLGAACLFRPDPLEPVPHVEGIVGMAAAQGSARAVAALVSLALLPAALAWFLARPVGLVLAVYVTGTLVAAWLGNYPVPVLGYGVSPILGYCGAVAAASLVARPASRQA